MTIINSSYLTQLRTVHPHANKLYMSIYNPPLVYVGTIAEVYTRGTRLITCVDDSGDISDVRAGDKAIIKSSAGIKKSIRRVKSVAGQVVTLDENAVLWAAGDQLYIYHDVKLFGIWPRMPKVGDKYVWYKDYDDAYTDGNLRPPPVACMGWHRAKILRGSYVTFTLTAKDSYAIAFGATITTILWECSTGVIDNAASETTTITFTTVGQHEVWLTVTDSNGKTQTTRRIFFVHDDPDGTGSYKPFLNFALENVTIDWSLGGVTTSLTFYGDDTTTIADNTFILIWSENYFSGSKNAVSLFDTTDAKATILNSDDTYVKFAGYLMTQSLVAQQDGTVNIQAASIDSIMKRITMASIALNNVASPSTWYEMYKLTVTRAIHHYFRWHSNLFDIADVILPKDDELELFASDDLTEGKLYESADTFAYQHGIFAHLCCDKYGRVHLQRDVEMYDKSDRDNVPVYFTLTKQDVKLNNFGAMISINRDTKNRIALAIVRGTSYAAGVTTPMISNAPGEIAEEGDSIVVFERIVLEDQDHANLLSGRIYAIGNREVVEMSIELAGNYYDLFDVVEQYFLKIDTSLGENYEFPNILNVNLSGLYTIKNITWSPRQDGSAELMVVLEPDTIDYGATGMTIPWPDDPDEIVPPTPRPPPPTDPNPPLPPPPPPLPAVNGLRALASCVSLVKRAPNIDDVSPTWTDIT